MTDATAWTAAALIILSMIANGRAHDNRGTKRGNVQLFIAATAVTAAWIVMLV